MPKDEFDVDDPLELNGVALYTDKDTSRDMAECFVEEFLRLRYNHEQILALFRNPHYLGMNMVLQNKGEAFVKEIISDTFATWGRPFQWAGSSALRTGAPPHVEPPSAPEAANAHGLASSSCSGACTCGASAAPPVGGSNDRLLSGATLTDPFGQPVPKLNL